MTTRRGADPATLIGLAMLGAVFGAIVAGWQGMLISGVGLPTIHEVLTRRSSR